MAHECPECGMTCHCGGDIDDCEYDNTPEQWACTHCEEEDGYILEDRDDDWQDYDVGYATPPGI